MNNGRNLSRLGRIFRPFVKNEEESEDIETQAAKPEEITIEEIMESCGDNEASIIARSINLRPVKERMQFKIPKE